MDSFDTAVQVILKNEGGYANYLQDKGGPTNYGISLRFLKSLGNFGDFNRDGYINDSDIKALDVDKAKSIYKQEFWDKGGYGRINNEILAEAVFDFAVNLGPSTAHKLIQKAINLYSAPLTLKEDGILGEKTIQAINVANPLKLMLFFRSIVIWHYIQITEKDPTQKKFINGWLKRVWGSV